LALDLVPRLPQTFCKFETSAADRLHDTIAAQA